MDEMIEVLARYRYNAKHDADRIKALEDELGRMRADIDSLRRRYADAINDNTKLFSVNAEMNITINASQAECRRLKAEVERLTICKSGADYLKANEGKQS